MPESSSDLERVPEAVVLPPLCSAPHPQSLIEGGVDVRCLRDVDHRPPHQNGDRVWRSRTEDPHAWPAPRPAGVLGEIADERRRQDAKWGEQNHPDLAPDLDYPSRVAVAL